MATTDLSRSNSLVDLAARIRAEHEAAHTAVKRGIEHAMAAGALLIEAKEDQLKHGEWLPWLRKHCQFSERTARLYMRLARSREELEAKSATVADLTLNRAAELLTPEAEADPWLAGGEAILERIREAEHRLMEAVEVKMEEQRVFATEKFPEMSPDDQEAWLGENGVTRRQIAHWSKISKADVSEAQWRISLLF